MEEWDHQCVWIIGYPHRPEVTSLLWAGKAFLPAHWMQGICWLTELIFPLVARNCGGPCYCVYTLTTTLGKIEAPQGNWGKCHAGAYSGKFIARELPSKNCTKAVQRALVWIKKRFPESKGSSSHAFLSGPPPLDPHPASLRESHVGEYWTWSLGLCLYLTMNRSLNLFISESSVLIHGCGLHTI